MSDLKPLVIKSGGAPPASKQYTWEILQQMPNFIDQIESKAVSEEDGDISKLGTVISGMPSVYARANMFPIALKKSKNKSSKNQGLIKFFESLVSEWRGLIACIALNNKKITIKRINLKSEDASFIYDVPGSFGNMLFESHKLWSDHKVDDGPAFIDVILYRKENEKMVIGGTNPESLVFTSATYDLKGEEGYFINPDTGYFQDPTHKQAFVADDILTLRSYVNHMKENIEQLEQYFKEGNITVNDGEDYLNIKTNLNNWISELDEVYKAKTGKTEFVSNPPTINLFGTPFDKVLNYSKTISAKNGIISSSPIQGATAFDPDELLLDSEKFKLASVNCANKKDDFLKGKPTLLLRAKVSGSNDDVEYFLLPFSPKGIKVFGESMSTLLGYRKDTNVGSSLTATVSHERTGSIVKVELTIVDDKGQKFPPIEKEYKVSDYDVSAKDIILWPNFVSEKWNKYYYYSEMPHNSLAWRAVPFCAKDLEDTIDYNEEKNDLNYVVENEKPADLESQILVYYNRNKLGSSYQYEIIESKNPFKGFKITHNDALVGFIMVEYGKEPNSPLRHKTENNELKKAWLGIDFGSTNSAVAYRSEESYEPQGYTFKNRRISLLATNENKEGDSLAYNNTVPAVEDEVLFFQNDEIKSNSIKSILSVHENTRMFDDSPQKSGKIIELAKQNVKGGFPCFEKNLPIETSDNKRHTLKFQALGISHLIHNMKWDTKVDSGESMDESNREAYLKNLLLHIYADLFDKDLYPHNLKWAFPSAMSHSLVMRYNAIWRELGSINPLDENRYQLSISQSKGDVMRNTIDHFGSSSSGETDSFDSFGSSSSFDDSSFGSDSGFSAFSDPQEKENNTKKSESKGLSFNDSAIKFSFDVADFSDNKTLTESEALASFLLRTKNSKLKLMTEPNVLTLCFDIGGSTTDLIVATTLKQDPKSNDPNNDKPGIIKQSSIRFAAKLIAEATRYSKNFKNVVHDYFEKENIMIEGITKGEPRFDENTAPYYFEQLVDRLENEEYNKIYDALSLKCQDLFAVNLYVTGAIMFYAGQVAKKCKIELDRSEQRHDSWGKPRVKIVFTGKGSRIMDWFAAVNPQANKQYFEDLFMSGFGGIDEIRNHLSNVYIQARDDEASKEIKYEIAKGLVSTHPPGSEMMIPNDSNQIPLEIIGEEGFEIKTNDGMKELSSIDTIVPEYLNLIAKSFIFKPKDINNPCPRFADFSKIFYSYAKKYFDYKASVDDFKQGWKEMEFLSDYIKQQDDYIKAQEKAGAGEPFDYVVPIFVIEALKFYEEIILKKL